MSNSEREDLLEEAADQLRRDDDEYNGSGGGKKILLILLPILLLGGGAGVYYSGILEKKLTETAETKPTVPTAAPVSTYFDLPEMLVNLNSVGPRANFLKLQASLELEDGADTAILTIMTPRIVDKFHVYMRELRLNDLRASAGLDRLREELRTEINKAVSPVEIKQVLFRNMLVQ